MKKILSILLSICLFGVFSTPAMAAIDDQEKSTIINVAQAFLQNYIEKSMLYEDTDMTSQTVMNTNVSEIANMADAAIEPSFILSSGPKTLSTLKQNILSIEMCPFTSPPDILSR